MKLWNTICISPTSLEFEMLMYKRSNFVIKSKIISSLIFNIRYLNNFKAYIFHIFVKKLKKNTVSQKYKLCRPCFISFKYYNVLVFMFTRLLLIQINQPCQIYDIFIINLWINCIQILTLLYFCYRQNLVYINT